MSEISHNSVVKATFRSTFFSPDWLTCQGESLSPLTMDSECVRFTFTFDAELFEPGALDVDRVFLEATVVPENCVS